MAYDFAEADCPAAGCKERVIYIENAGWFHPDNAIREAAKRQGHQLQRMFREEPCFRAHEEKVT